MSIGTTTPRGLEGEGARRGSRRYRRGAARPPSASTTKATFAIVLGLLAVAAGAGPVMGKTPYAPGATASTSTPTYSTGSEYVLIAAQPSVRIASRSATISANGYVLIDLSCPAGVPEGCRGAVAIRQDGASGRGLHAGCGRACRALGSAPYRAHAGARTRVRVHVSPRARRALLRRTSVRVIVTATTVAGGHTTTVRRTIMLRTRPGA